MKIGIHHIFLGETCRIQMMEFFLHYGIVTPITSLQNKKRESDASADNFRNMWVQYDKELSRGINCFC